MSREGNNSSRTHSIISIRPYGSQGRAVSQEAIQKILGLEGKVHLRAEEMAAQLRVTFFPPRSDQVSEEVKQFANKLEATFRKLKVTIVPYHESLTHHRVVSSKIKIGKKVKRGISLIALGEGREGNLPIDHLASFMESSVITIVDMPPGIDHHTDFHQHFETAIRLFARHMTHIVIGVDKKKWVLYNFNASHPLYPLDENFEDHVLHALVPKIAAPVKPPKISDFVLRHEAFDPDDRLHKPLIQEIVESGSLLEETGLYPPGKSIDELPFRNEFYKRVGRLILDHRSDMSYGFLARQLPVKLPVLIPFEDAKVRLKCAISSERDYISLHGNLFLILSLPGGRFYLKVPEVWVITQRSGCHRTRIDPQRDIIKMGLVHGKMILETPQGLIMSSDYKPSFDSRVIVAHAVGNAIVGAVLLHLFPEHPFPKRMQREGMALSHFHGYVKKALIPKGWHIHGETNPHVSCSSPQSAVYALDGKIRAFWGSLFTGQEFLGDIHIEPHHGTNITFSSLKDLGAFFIQRSDIAKLGNCYLPHYHSQ